MFSMSKTVLIWLIFISLFCSKMCANIGLLRECIWMLLIFDGELRLEVFALIIFFVYSNIFFFFLLERCQEVLVLFPWPYLVQCSFSGVPSSTSDGVCRKGVGIFFWNCCHFSVRNWNSRSSVRRHILTLGLTA